METSKILDICRLSFLAYYDVMNSNDLGKEYKPMPLYQKKIADKLQQFYKDCEEKKSPRLILSIPPRHSKSVMVNTNFATWVMGKQPKWNIALATYGSELSTSFGMKAKDRVTSELYKAIFPEIELRKDSKSKDLWTNTDGGEYNSTSVQSPITGKGYRILICDDVYKDRMDAESPAVQKMVWEWYLSTAQSRMEDGGGIIIIMQRWNQNDLVAKVLEQAETNKEAGLPYTKWEVINFPILATEDSDWRKQDEPLWEDKYGKEYINLLRANTTEYFFQSQYQQNPIANSAQVFKENMINYFEEDTLKSYEQIITCLDPAISQRKEADNSAIVTIGVRDNKVYVLETTFGQFTADRVLKELFRHQDKYGSVVGIETIAAQKLWVRLINEKKIETKQTFKIIEFRPMTNKEARIADSISPYIENGKLYLRKHQTALIDELLTFPRGRRDDIVDCLAMCIILISKKKNISLSVQTAPQSLVNSLIRKF